MKLDQRAFAAQSTTWLVLRCASSKTMNLARLLSDFDSEDSRRYPDLGAWTPVWKRRVRARGARTRRLQEVAALPSFVFIPRQHRFDLPVVPGIPYSLMRFDDAIVLVRDQELTGLRKIDMQPKDPIKVLPKIGSVMRFNSGPFQGLEAKVIYCTNRKARVVVKGFSQPIEVPPSILQEIG